MVIDPLSPILKAIELLLSRYDRHKDLGQADLDYRRAAMELFESAELWSLRAVDLRDSLVEWEASGARTAPEEYFRLDVVAKQDSMIEFDREFGRIYTFLRLHEPDLAAEFAFLTERSADNIAAMLNEVSRARGPEELRAYVAGFSKRTDEVVRAVDSLRQFLSAAFPPG